MVINRDKKKDLEILGLSGIFQGIYNNKRNGILYVQSGNREKYIYFWNGNISLVASLRRSSILAEGLRRSFGQIDDETLNTVFQIQGETGKSLSTILLEMNADEEFISNICLLQMGEEIFEIFIWPDIQFEFLDQEPSDVLFPPELLALKIEINPGVAMMEAARNLDQWKNFVEEFPSLKDIPYICADIYDLSPEECHLLTLCDGGHDIEEILKLCRLPMFQAMSLLYNMSKNLGYLRLRTADELIQMAQFDEFRNNIHKSIKLYERAEELEGVSIDTLRWLAEAYETSGLIGKAVAKYQKLGDLCLEKEDLDGSIEAYERVIAYAPENLSVHKQYVNVLFQKEEYEKGSKASIVYAQKISLEDKSKAIEVLEYAYQNNPFSAEVLEYMATLYNELGKYDDACFIYTTLGNLYKRQNDFDATIIAYKKILDINAKNIEARFALANTYSQIGMKVEGLQEYKILADLLRSKEFLESSFGCRYLIIVCEKIIEYEADNYAAREWLADVFLYQENFEKAKVYLLELLEFLEKSSFEENLETWVSVLQKLVQLEPRNRDYRRMLAETYHRLEYYDDATNELITLGFIAIAEGTELYSQGKDQDAQELFQESLDALNFVLIIDPFHLEVRKKRAELLEQLGHIDVAVEEYKCISNMTKAINDQYDTIEALLHIVELVPDEIGAILELAKMYEKQNQIDLSNKFYKQYAYHSLIQGDFGEAIQTCRKLSALLPNDEDIIQWREIATELQQ